MVIIVYGPPGSGKGTQAQTLADYFGLFHFDTGRVIEQAIYDPNLQNDPVIQRERKLFDSGILCTPEWVTELVRQKIQALSPEAEPPVVETSFTTGQEARYGASGKGKGIVFSGSPRTFYEAERIMPLLLELYGKEKIHIIRIAVKPETSIFRNSNRKVCKDCSRPLVFSKENAELENCPVCGGNLEARVHLDSVESIKTRLEEYKNRTEPVYKYLEEKDIKIIDIDGEPAPQEVTKEILKKLQ